MERTGDTSKGQEQYHCTFLQLLAMLALGSGAYRKQQEPSVVADPKKTLVVTFPCKSSSYKMSFYNENDTSRRHIFKSKNGQFAKWKAVLQPVTLHIEGAAEKCKLISTISEALQNKRPTFTILLHDICQLAARLFRLKGYSEIVVKCDEDLLCKIFITFKEEELMLTKFLAWFSTVCLTESDTFPLMDPIICNDFTSAIFQQKPNFDTDEVPCIQYNDRSLLIWCVRNNGVGKEKMDFAHKLLPELHHIKDEWWTASDPTTLCKLLKEWSNSTSSEKTFASDISNEESSAREESTSKRLILLPCATMLEFFDVIRGMKKKDESKEEEQALADGMCRRIFETIRNEVDSRQNISPESRHHLGKRLAILTILFLEAGDRQNKGSDAGSYFSKAFSLLEQTCSKKCKVASLDSTRPHVLLPAQQARTTPPDSLDLPASAESTQLSESKESSTSSLSKKQLWKKALQASSKEYDGPKKSEGHTATCWEVEVPRKLLLRVPSCYDKNKVLVALLYLAFCDAASSFYQLLKEKGLGCIEFPCLLEFYHLKQQDESIEVATLMGEYICLLKTLCSKRFNSLEAVQEYHAESIGFDFCIIEKTDGQATARHRVSVKSYTDKDRTIFYVSRDDASHDVDGTKLKKLAEMCVETTARGLDWTSILFNCSGENCTLGAMQQWEVSKLKPTTSEAANCACCWRKKEGLLKHLKKEFDPQDNDSQDKDSHGNAPQDKDSQDKDSQDKDSQDKDSQDKDSQDKDSQDKDSQDKDSQEKDPQDRDPQDKDSEASDSCDKFKQGFFIPSDVFFSMRFALGNFQLSSRTEKSLQIRELLKGFLRDSDKERRASFASIYANTFVAR